MHGTAVVIESQPDWITASIHDPQRVASLHHYADSLIPGELAAGAKVRAWAFYGYTGYSVGRVRYGEREGAACIQLSGDLAHKGLSHTRLLADGVTRFDIAVTVRLPESDDKAADRSYDEAMAWRLVHPRAALPSLFQNGDGGATLYVGRRTSDAMLRMYNKEAERRQDKDDAGAEHYARCWRYELEVKGETALPLARVIDESPDRAKAVQAYVHDWSSSHGLIPLFPHSGAQVLLPGFHRRSDRERTLAWFRSSVGPAIRRLLDSGPDHEVYEALGIPLPEPPIDNPPMSA